MPISLGYKGISFPFRINVQGGVVMTSTSAYSVPHIVESIHQILGTNYLERAMEPDVYSDMIAGLFEPNDKVLQNVMKHRIVNAITRLDDRVSISEDDITFEIERTEEGSVLYANLVFEVDKYETSFTERVKVGEL